MKSIPDCLVWDANIYTLKLLLKVTGSDLWVSLCHANVLLLLLLFLPSSEDMHFYCSTVWIYNPFTAVQLNFIPFYLQSIFNHRLWVEAALQKSRCSFRALMSNPETSVSRKNSLRHHKGGKKTKNIDSKAQNRTHLLLDDRQ